MYEIGKKIEWDAAHRLVNYQGKCQWVHGHRYTAQVCFESAYIDSRGILVDFTDVNERVKKWIMDNWDHGTLVSDLDELMITFLKRQENKYFVIPQNPTAENIAYYLYKVACEKFPNVKISGVTIYETPTSHATYRPD